MNVKTKRIWIAVLCLACVQSVQAQNGPDARSRVSLSFNAVPFRDALQMLFKNSGLQYTIDPNVPNSPITLNLRDMPLELALRVMVRDSGVPNLTYRKESDVYVIKIRPSELVTEEMIFEKLPIQFQRVDHILRELQGGTGSPEAAAGPQSVSLIPEGIASINPSKTDNTLIVRGTPEGLETLKNLVRLIDIPERTLVLTVSVTGPGVGPRPLAIQSSARTLNARSVTIDEEIPAGTQRSKVKVKLEPFIRGDNAIHVDADWDVSVSVPGAKGETIRLVKRFQSSTALDPGVGTAVSTVDLSTWGGSGEVRFWLKAQLLRGSGRSVTGSKSEMIENQVRLVDDVPYVTVGAIALNLPAELVRSERGYELELREKGLPEGVIQKGARPKAPGMFRLAIHGRTVSERMMFIAEYGDRGIVSDPDGEPYIPLEDLARALGGKLEFDPLTDNHRIVGGQGFMSLFGTTVSRGR